MHGKYISRHLISNRHTKQSNKDLLSINNYTLHRQGMNINTCSLEVTI